MPPKNIAELLVERDSGSRVTRMDIGNKSMPSRALSPHWLQSQALGHAARTTMAATVSLLTARLFGLPESYWAAVTTLIVMQSTLGAALTVSVRRLIGTALGAAIGAVLATYFGPNILAYGAGIFLLGLLCVLLAQVHERLPEYLDRTAYRYGSVALTIIVMVVRSDPAWIIALHRFIEVSIGIVVGLVLTMLWSESQPRCAHWTWWIIHQSANVLKTCTKQSFDNGNPAGMLVAIPHSDEGANYPRPR